MLVLSRFIGEKIVLRLEDGRELVVAVADVDRGKVRIGVEAPRSVVIFRSELRDSYAPPEDTK